MSFLFGQEAPSYEALKRRREIADMLMQQTMSSQPDNIGEGIAMLGKAILARRMDNKLGPQEDAARQQAMQELMRIKGGMEPEGITMEQMQGLGGVVDNPYGGSAVDAIARTLMRREMTPSQQGGFSGGGLGELVAVSSKGPPEGPQSGGAFGWTDPGEIPPEDDQQSMLPVQMAQNTAGQPPAPFDLSEAIRQQMLMRASSGEELTDGGAQNIQQQFQNMPGNRPMSGAGTPLAQGPTTGPMVAEADTGTKSDGKSPITREQQAKYLGFWNRMDGSEPRIQEMESVLSDAAERGKDAVPLVGNALVSEQFQQARRAADDWLMGLLRVDTGMTINNQELARMEKAYIPQAWDGPAVIKDKREARARAMEGIKAGLGPAEILADELALQREKAAKENPAPNDADAELFKKYGLE